MRQQAHALVVLFRVAERGLLVRRVVDQPVLPLGGAFVGAHRRVEGGVAGEALVHRNDVGLGDVERRGDLLDLVGVQIAVVERGDLALHLAQVEEQTLLRRGGADLDQAPRAQDVFLDGGANPPHRVGREAEALVGLEALDGVHQADIALRDHLGDGQAIAAIAHGNLGHEAQMGRDEFLRSARIFVFLVALGEHELLVRLQHRKLPDFLEITGETTLGREDGQIGLGH